MPDVALADYLLAAGLAVIAGLDRTAALQLMISRPIVAAPLTGWLLGDPLVGLQLGALVELLWIGRLPVGAAIPPDDTQVSIGGTVLAITMGTSLGYSGPGFIVLCTLIAMPLGKFGQYFDRLARHRNNRLLQNAEAGLDAGHLKVAETYHLIGLMHFAFSSLATFVVIVAGGSLLVPSLVALLLSPVVAAVNWLWLLFPLVGTAVFLGTINVKRSMSLFGASFTSAFLLLWLL